MFEASCIRLDSPVPLFPLGTCVMLPHACVPLHIFETRYRAMTRDVIDGCGMLAMAVFEGENWKTAYEGTPPIRPVVCVGRLARYHHWEDGRYNILLQGLARARIVQECDLHPDGYRLAYLEPLETSCPDESCFACRREHLEELLHDESLQTLAAMASMQNLLCSEMPTLSMIDVCAQHLCCCWEDRYQLLAEPDPFTRADWLIAYLKQMRQSLLTADRHGPCTDENGLSRN